MESSDIDIFSAAFVHLLFQLFGRQRPRCGNPVVVPVVIDRGVIETPSLAVSWDFLYGSAQKHMELRIKNVSL